MNDKENSRVKVFYFVNNDNMQVEEIEKVVDITWSGDFLEVQTNTGFLCFNKKNVIKFTFIEDENSSLGVYCYRKNAISKLNIENQK